MMYFYEFESWIKWQLRELEKYNKLADEKNKNGHDVYKYKLSLMDELNMIGTDIKNKVNNV
jgi:hypothetical protein